MRDARLNAILTILEKQDFATVEYLSEALHVSLPTIRRDLALLAQRKNIVRTRGGAMHINVQQSFPISYRRVTRTAMKIGVARKAAELVRENQVIFIDSSSTANFIVQYLRKLNNVTIVTNSLETAASIKNINATTYCLCGNIIENFSSVGGHLAVESAGFFHIDTFFFSAYGVDPRGRIVESSDAEIDLKYYLLKNAECSVFLCDRSKFDKTAAYVLGSLSDVDYLVTNPPFTSYPCQPRKKIILTE